MKHLMGVLLGVVFFCQPLQAQKHRFDHWKFGHITLNSGQRIQGELKFDLSNNVVVLRSGEQMQAHSAYSVRSFTAVDSLSGFPQKFYSLPYAETAQRPQQMFFQLVFKDSFALFVRERKVPAVVAQVADFPTRPHPLDTDVVFAHTYYVSLPDGDLQELKSGARNIAKLFALEKERKAIQRYMADKDVDFQSQPDIIRLINHFVGEETYASR